MKKILFLSNTANFSKFNRPYMRWFKEQGWQVDYCSAGEENVLDCDNQYSICIVRSPFSLKNFKALKQLKELLKNNKYDILHCHKICLVPVLDGLIYQSRGNEGLACA